MTKTLNYLKREMWDGFSTYEKLFMWGMVLLQVIVYCLVPDSLIGMVCGISGVICVVLTAKGRVASYIFNFIQIITYMVICWQYKLYLEFGENIFYFITCIYGVYAWKANLTKNDDGTADVKARRFNPWQWVATAAIGLIGTIGLGLFGEKILGSTLPYYDAFTNVMALVAQMLMVWRFSEQWIVWILIDLTCLVMFIILGQWSMVAMYVAWTINAFYGWYNWNKLVKESQ
jgi:nicotinamide mononucleotide transporter